jgi:PAS domain S-box-containing protein
MSALAESAMAITTSLGTQDILTRVLEEVKKALNVEAVSIALADADRNILTFRASIGHLSEKVIGKQARIGEGIAGLVAQSGRALVVPDAQEDERFNPNIDRQTGFKTRAIACAPIRAGGVTIGVIEAFNPIDGAFDPEAELLLTGIGSMAGSVIHHGELFERLQAAHRNYRELFDDSIDLILITDWAGLISQYNRQAAETIRVPGGDLTGCNIYDLHAFDEEAAGDAFATRLTAQETISYESDLRTPGGLKPVRVFVRRIRLENEDLLQWLLHDITERKSMDALRDELISMIYHDLRSPLANVMYSIEMLQSVLPPENLTGRTLIEVANRATNRIQRLTNSLLDIKTLEAGQPVTNRTEVPVSEFITNAVDAIRPLAEAKDQHVETDLSLNSQTVNINRDMITRVLINLLENAVKYTPGKGRIRAGAKQAGVGIEVWVEDNGPGIPREHWDGIFNKYTRLDNRDLGFGLGLSFCRLAVEGHGGSIWIEPVEGRGARFVFSLPKD